MESEAAGWKAYLRKTDKIKVSSEYLLNHPEYGRLLAKNFRPLNRELERWQEEPYEKVQNIRKTYWYWELMGKCYGLNQKQLLTECCFKIKYRFIMKKNSLDGIILYPDFMIRHPITGQYFYWEHFGMMDNPDYCKHACDKIKLYCQHGIIPSVNLILTYETKQYPLSADKVEMICRNILVVAEAMP